MSIGFGLQKCAFAHSVIPLKILNNPSLKEGCVVHLLQYTKYKKLPSGYDQEALAALSHFPELQKVPVKFRIKKSYCTLKTKPTLLSLFMPKGHCSFVIINNKAIKKLTPIMFENLPENARIGIIGHELSHVADFSKKNTWQSFKTVIGHLSKH